MFKSVFKSGIRGTYNVSDNASFHTESWAAYPAKHKQTGKAVTVFIFDKTKFESLVNRLCALSPNTKNPRSIISECYELIKSEVSHMTKLKHPQILTIIEVLEETKLKFLFVSEPVVANLATLDLRKEDELSIQKGLLEISKGLQFLHNFCSIIHLNLQPSSVFVTNQGDWKLAGFKFLQILNELTPLDRENFYIMNNSSVVPFANLNLNFTAPELIVDSSGIRLTTANDLWSLGLLIYYLYNKGDLLVSCFDSNSPSEFKGEFRKFEQKFYNHRPSELKYLLKEVPETLWMPLTQLLARYPNDRISIDQFIDSDFFSGSLIKTMWFIDEFSTKTMEEKLIFLDGLLGQGDVLSQLPSTFKKSKLLPLLVEVITSELTILTSKPLDTQMDSLISNSLLVVFKIGEDLSNLSFQDRIFETLLSSQKVKKNPSPLEKLSKTSVKTRLAIIENMPLLLIKLHTKQVVEIIKEMSNLCLTFTATQVDLQADQIRLQDTFLEQLSTAAEMFDFPYIKNTMIPLLCQVFKTTTVLSTKLQTLSTFQIFIDKKVIDKVIVTDQLLPVLENIKSRDRRIVEQVVAFFIGLSKSEHIVMDMDIMVDRVLVQCLRLAFGCNNCNATEFKQLVSSVITIQNDLLERRMRTLPQSTLGDAPPSNNFDSLINTRLLRNANKDEVTKAPQLKPMAPAKDAPRSSRESPRPSGTPLTLRHNTAPTNFGANSRPNPGRNTLPVPIKPPVVAEDDDDDTFLDFQKSTPNSSFAGSGAIDWSSERNKPQQTTSHSVNSSVLQPQNFHGHGQQPNNGYTNGLQPLSFGQTLAANGNAANKLPPGFMADLVLTPNSGSTSQNNHTTKNTNSLDLLDFL